uniref:Uncharacterized protein n=1 Tax=Megaviridae environmental sample TaxID=1737588 RepID=A0A5J6VKS1_9VIRU|nr:MAG: hypothetical protein [Megaviridae environmental sample]
MGSCNTKTSEQIHPINNECILDWRSDMNMTKYHWWPMKFIKSNPLGNNLYSEGGALDKYDELFNSKSRNYQKKNYYRAEDSDSSDRDWAGFCDKASILACLYEYPKISVDVEYNDKIIKFTRKDIEALMILACDKSIKKNISLFFGSRNNTNNLKEPLPSDLYKMINIST